jgi:hypothetical protein
MLKYALETLDGVDESVAGFYEKGEAGYTLKVDGIPREDVSGLKKKVDELLAEKKAADAKRREAEEAARLADEERARKSGDLSALEKSWQDKLARIEAEKSAALTESQKQIQALTVGRTATDIAAEIAVPGTAKVLLPHISSRLSVDVRDGVPVVVVLDTNGKPSAASLEELKQELANDPAFAPLIVGSKASGGGAAGATRGGAGPKTITRTAFEQMSPMQRMEFAKAGGSVTE